MSIPGSASPLFFQTAAGAAAGFSLQKSVRFSNDDSAYLNRTPIVGGNRKKFTYSTWVKRSDLSDATHYALFSAGTSSYNIFGFRSDGRVRLEGNAPSMDIHTLGKLRDPSAWYHIVFAIDTTQATASNRVKIYINGVQQDLGSSTYPAQNGEFSVNDNSAVHQIGRYSTSRYFDGYMASTVFIDESQEDCTSFGEFDDNGVWRPIDVSGLTFGTNGFHLFDFANESGIGNDASGNDNDFTVNNLSNTDVLFDVPTNGDSSGDTGAGGEVSGNYATWNPLTSRGVVTTSQGNLTANAVNSGYGYTLSTIPVSSGKYYCEISFEGTMAHSVNYNYIGIVPTDSAAIYTGQDIFRADGALSIDSNGSVIRGNIGNGSNDTNNTYQSSYGFDENDTIGIAIDCDTPQVTFYKNGTSIGTFPHTMQSNKSWVLFINDWANAADFTGYVLNTGQKAFEDSAPSGFKALCTTNLPTPTIANGRDHFDTKLYTGNGGSSTIAVSGYNFAPNLVWLKGRSDPDKHGLYDTVRGATKLLIPSSANGESTQNGVTAFNSDGFDIGDYAETNGNNRTYVAWAWNIPGSASSNSDGTITSSVTKNVDAGISIVTWTGDDSTGTIGHGLGSKPDLIVAKVYGDSSYSDNWPVYSSVFDGTHYAYLNDTRKFTDFAGFWNDGTATSTVFPVGDYNTDDTKSLLALCFTSVAGFSSIGSYEGNGSTTAGVFVYMDFRPAWILVKRADTSSSYGSWAIYDSTRSTFNTTGTSSYNFPLWANRDAQEGKRGNGSDAASGFENIVNFFSNGFMALGAGAELNVANETYVYMAFASNPFSANGGLAF
jgi:hypothetical protein